MEGYVSNELIGIIGATIALTAVYLATMRGVRGDVRGLREEVRNLRTDMRESLAGVVKGSRNEIKEGDSRLHDAMNDSAGKLRDEMNAGFKEITSRLVNVGDRLSKVEGIIEGIFWSARNQPPDKPRAGAA